MSAVFTMSAIELADAIRNKRLGVEELTRAYIERIERFDGPDGLNAVVELNENAIRQAGKMDSMKTDRDGAMFGLPVLIKDNIDVTSCIPLPAALLSQTTLQRKTLTLLRPAPKRCLDMGKTNMTDLELRAIPCPEDTARAVRSRRL